MKNKEKKHLASQSPNIYRIITESKIFKKLKKLEFRLILQSKHKKLIYYSGLIVSIILIVFLICGISVLSFKFYENIRLVTRISSERQALQEKINFWQSIANKYEGYKDAYFQTAFLEYKLGNFKKALEYNKKALLLDPNFEDSKKLEVLLEKK